MTVPAARERGNAVLALVVAVALIAIIGPLVLHFTQKRHDQLPAAVLAEFPPDRTVVPGEVFGSTLVVLMEHELGGASGWRPNDFVLWGPNLWADNNANRQLGILQVERESVRVLKDHLTKVSSTEYDDNLQDAYSRFQIDPEKLWLPSAEGSYSKGIEALRKYVAGLRTTPPSSKPIQRRNVEVIRLFQSWSDILGDTHEKLFKTDVPLWQTDDYYYHALGVAHAMHHLMLAVQREYQVDLVDRPTLAQLMTEVADTLGTAAAMKPIVVLDGSATGLTANHRRNLDTYIVDARQKMYSIREELEK
jgi:hypothetical protein